MRFESFLGRDSEHVGPGGLMPESWSDGAPGFQDFMDCYAGCTFGGGLYRVHLPSELTLWTERMLEMFPEFVGRALCFASDWMGQQFAIDKQRSAGGEFLTLMFEPGTGHALEIPVSFGQLHETELVEQTNAMLAIGAFRKWIEQGNPVPSRAECVGYKTPLFLGGADEFSNMELVSMEVYWSLHAQIWMQVRGLPEGTPIGKVTIG